MINSQNNWIFCFNPFYSSMTEIQVWICFEIIFLYSVQTDETRRPCAGRDYGKGSIVCVCNETYCDDLSPIRRTAQRVVKVFETSKSGDRFAEGELFFDYEERFPYDINIDPKVTLITLNRSQTFQKIIGFGGAFTDSAGLNLRTLPTSLQFQAISDYFSQRGIEYTLGRIPIGGTDFSTRPYTYDDVEGDFSLEHFALTAEDLDFKVISIFKNGNPFFHLKTSF